MSLQNLSIELRKNNINKKLDNILFHMENIKQKKEYLYVYDKDSENIYQQIYKNLILFYEEYKKQLLQLQDNDLINNVGVVDIIVSQKIREKYMKKEIKQYIKFFYEIYTEYINLKNNQ